MEQIRAIDHVIIETQTRLEQLANRVEELMDRVEEMEKTILLHHYVLDELTEVEDAWQK